MRTLLLIAAAVQSAVPAHLTKPASPAKWVVNYSPNSCEILRLRQGDENGILLRLRPHANSHEVKVLTAPMAGKVRAEVISSSVRLPEPLYPQVAKLGNTPDGKYGVIETTLDHEALRSAATEARLTFTGKTLGTVSVSTVGLAKAMTAAATCLDDLAKQWNAARTWAVDPVAVSDPRSVFLADDYPEKMRDANRQGAALVLLAIDSDGKVAGCRPVEVDGDETFGDVTCKILKKRAHFTPAKDAAGRVVPSFYLAPRVTWSLSG